MSGPALQWARQQRAPCLTSKAVLMCLADYAGVDGTSWPSIGLIAAEVQCSRSTVQRAIRALVEAGLIDPPSARQRDRDGGRSSNEYRVRIGSTPQVKMTPPPGQNDLGPQVTSDLPPRSLVTPPYEPPLEPLSVSDEPERERADVRPIWIDPTPTDDEGDEVDPDVEPFPVDPYPVDPFPVEPFPIALTAEIIPISPAVARSAERRAAGAAKRRPCPLPDDFAPDDTTTRLIREIGLTRRQVTDAIDQMRDWHLANGQTKADWQATLRGWLRRDRDRPLRLSGPGTRPDPAGVTDAAAEALRIIRARHQA